MCLHGLCVARQAMCMVETYKLIFSSFDFVAVTRSSHA